MIDEKDMERLREVFVTRQECNRDMSEIESKISAENVRLSVIETQLKVITGILAAIGTGVLSVIIKLFFVGV